MSPTTLTGTEVRQGLQEMIFSDRLTNRNRAAGVDEGGQYECSWPAGTPYGFNMGTKPH